VIASWVQELGWTRPAEGTTVRPSARSKRHSLGRLQDVASKATTPSIDPTKCIS
jgi:hypothetical protein